MIKPASNGNGNLLKIQHALDDLEEEIPLELPHLAYLLNQGDPGFRKEIGLRADQVKERYHGKQIKLFCPLYLSNDCVNNCLYCGFRRGNSFGYRRTLTVEEALNEARQLARRGFRRLTLVAADHPRKVSVQYLRDVIGAIRQETDIQYLTLNIASLATEEFAALREAGAAAYQCFQETYNPFVYSFVHRWSKSKRDYLWRFGAFERAILAGFSRVGMGVLLGLCDFRFDILSLLSHARIVLDRFPEVEVTLSLPRFRPAAGALLPEAPLPVSDEEFAYAVAICRLALPKADIAISTRERPALRDNLMTRGASMMSAESVTYPGGHTFTSGEMTHSQFTIEDTRTVEQVHADLVARGLTPVY